MQAAPPAAGKDDMISLAVQPLSLAVLIDHIQHTKGFAFARYGDGTFFCMQGCKGKNCDGVVYTPEQASSLIATLYDKNIWHGIGNLALRDAHAAEWLHAHNIELDWYDANVIHQASETGKLFPLIEVFRKRKIIFCGPAHLRKLKAFPIQRFVECHATKAFDEIDALDLEIGYRIEQCQADTVLLSAGLGAAPTLVSRLHRDYPDVVILDTGSVWDPYCGVYSRRTHRKRGLTGTVSLAKINLRMDIRTW